MIYLVAVVFGFVISILTMAAEIIRGNIKHVENGRDANAKAVLLPTIIVIPLFFIGVAGGVDKFFPADALTIFCVICFVLISAIGISISRLKRKFYSLKKS